MRRLVRHLALLAAAASAAAGALACHRAPESGGGAGGRPGGDPTPAAAASPATRDTARGVVMLSGNEPVATLVLLRAAGGPLALAGDATTVLRAVAGLEVVVRGRLTTERVPDAAPGGAPLFRAEAFTVRAADGVAAHDGVVVSRDGAWRLHLTDGGEVPAPHLPAALRAMPGARVYLVGALDRVPIAFGVIGG